MESVGERIKRLRKNMGLTQSDLAEKLNLECAAVSKYETNRVPLTQESLIKLADIFNVSTDYLLGLNENKTLNQPIEIAASTKDKLDISALSDKGKEYIIDLVERMTNN